MAKHSKASPYTEGIPGEEILRGHSNPWLSLADLLNIEKTTKVPPHLLMRSLRRSLQGVLLGVALGIVLGFGATSAGAALRGSAIFSDVAPSSFYDEAIGEMYGAGIIRGYADGKFGPNDVVTRGQLAVMFQRLRNDLMGVSATPQPTSRSRSSKQENPPSSEKQSSSESSSAPVSSATQASVVSRGPQGAIRFTTKAFTVGEAGKLAVVSIVRAAGNKGSVSVHYTATGGTAVAGSDYVAAAGDIVFADGETSKIVNITITDDSLAEGSETIALTLSSPTNGAVLESPSTATLTILDNETSGTGTQGGATSAAPSVATIGFGAGAYMMAENGGPVTISVVRTGPATSAVSVNYATANGSAKSSDYSPASGTLSFAANETTKSFTISSLDDTSIEGNATVNVTLSAPTGGAVLASPSSSQLTIVDNESLSFGTGTLRFAKSTALASEGENIALTIQRAGGANGTVSVNYATRNGSAGAGNDYTSVSGTVTFLPGEAAKTITIPVLNDSINDSEEVFSIDLSLPTGGTTITSPGSVAITIYD